VFLYIYLECPRNTALELDISIGSYSKLLFFNPDSKISRRVHLSKECGSTSSIDYPTEQVKSLAYTVCRPIFFELIFGFILVVGHERNITPGIL